MVMATWQFMASFARPARVVSRYGLAALFVSAALVLTLLLQLIVLDGATLFFLYGAVGASGWFGGAGPGWAAVVLSTIAVDYFLVPPLYEFELDHKKLPWIASFGACAIVSNALSLQRRRAEQELRRARDELEAKVQIRTADLQRTNKALLAEIAERKQAEARQRLLVDELNHRVKNTLTTVQSVAMQMMRGSEPPERFYQAFRARLLALSHAHDLLTRGAWQSASLRDLLRQMLAPYTTGDRPRIMFAGPDVHLSPNAAVDLAMAFHELATNAAKHGALSVPGGRIAISWTADGSGDTGVIHLLWAERGGPTVQPPARRGFGLRLIERGLAHELKAEVRLDFAPAGLECRIRLPLSRKVMLL
jgi:two-component sensor histidine kinase